ncbi:hypothetical protein [Sphingomonas sp.]|uniref:hypothetical protein n=1 Tax=Sphingomonas sp. TaxID=28214 RepID=UPI003F70F362
MSDSPLTPEQQAQVRRIAAEQATTQTMVAFLFAVVALIAAIGLYVIILAEWIFA